MSTANRVMLDTNILVYGRLAGSPLCMTVEERLTELQSAGDELWISRQILREFLAAMSRGTGLTATPSMADLLADVKHFCRRYAIAEDSAGVTQHLVRILSVVSCAGKQIHDANIVATMLDCGIPPAGHSQHCRLPAVFGPHHDRAADAVGRPLQQDGNNGLDNQTLRDNPTVETLVRYAEAVGKRLVVSLTDARQA